jgi:hypothetical protein
LPARVISGSVTRWRPGQSFKITTLINIILRKRTMPMEVRDFYTDPNVRARMIEFLGNGSLERSSSVYIINDYPFNQFEPLQPKELWARLNNGADVRRSLWDRKYLIAHLDLEYVNFDYPGEAYLHPERIFEIQRPVVQAIQAILGRHGIKPLPLLSGRGYHFVWAIRRNSKAFERLAKLGRVPESLKAAYAKPQPPTGEVIEPALGVAFAGLGILMEYLGHLVLEAAASSCALPIQMMAIEVGPREHGREIVSFDLSEYGDPLVMRSISIPFSAYLKPHRQRPTLGDQLVDEMMPMYLTPLKSLDEREGIAVRQSPERLVQLARLSSTRIPDYSRAMERLIDAYQGSALAKFHRWFYSQEEDPPEAWPATYDRMPLEVLPPCARTILGAPNDLLLKPAAIQLVVRVMLALGWHPRHIAGLIRSKYERDYHWGDRWEFFDPATRAEFYTRLFAGLVATGRDELVDLNNQSNKEKGYCFREICGYNLESFKHSLLERKRHERLGCRPFNRLFLPNEHF